MNAIPDEARAAWLDQKRYVSESTVLFVRFGNEYLTLGVDACIAAKVLGYELPSTGAAVRIHEGAVDKVLEKLAAAGIVATCRLGPSPATSYVVQVWCTDLGWVDSIHESPWYTAAVELARRLVADDHAWMSGRRLIRIAQRRPTDQRLATVPPLACYYPPGVSRGEWGDVPGAAAARQAEAGR